MTQSLGDQAYKIIKEKILNSKEEKYLSVRKMVKELDMSYTPVREAFQRLEREGFLELVPKLGYLIPKWNFSDIIKIFQVRECLEKFVLEKVFDLLTQNHVELLSGYLEKQIKNLDEENYREFYKNDELFHMLFFDIYNNPHLSTLIKNVRDKYMVGSTKTIMEIKMHGVVVAIDEHKKIITYIKAGEKARAVEELENHIKNSKERISEGYHLFS